MPGEAAKARAVQRGPGAVGFLLAHHFRDELDRCYLCWIGSRPVWLCARCTGVYPVLLLSLVAQAVWRPAPGWWDGPWLFVLPVPALVDWILGRFDLRGGSNLLRTLTGLALGAALGRTVFLHATQPGNVLVLVQLATLTSIVALAETTRYLLRHRFRE